METVLTQFRGLLARIRSYHEAVGVLYWDLRTKAPRKGHETRSHAVGILSAEAFKLSVSEEMGNYLQLLGSEDAFSRLTDVDQRLVREVEKEYKRDTRIPPDLYQEYVTLTTRSESVWEEAKQKSDFAMFAPYLEKIVAMTRKFVELWGYEGHPYNTLLDLYEPGMTVDVLDQVFGRLREEIVPLVHAVGKREPAADASFLRKTYPVEDQRAFSLFMLEELGYDFEAGRLDESEHPFATGLNPGDVRITTRYKPDDLPFALFGTIHECGHALYEQNIDPSLIGTPLCDGASMAMHESQSRLWEIYIGSSRPFWRRYFPDLQQQFPEQLAGVDAEQFYRAINLAKTSLIRIEADELTYNLHIMIRYELEKGLISGEIEVSDLPKLWKEKYDEYLGVVPSSDAEGVLQDVHWAGGSFGYFPSYSLGNMYGAQLMHALRKEMPDLDARIERGELLPIKQWLVRNVYRYGKTRTPDELILQATGEPLNPSYLIAHLKEKYG